LTGPGTTGYYRDMTDKPPAIDYLSVADLILDQQNVRKHSPENVNAIAASLRQFGQQTPIVVDADFVVRKGNGTVMARQQIGWGEVQFIRTKLRGKAARAYSVADNRTGDLSEFDQKALLEELRLLEQEDPNLRAAAGFSEQEVRELEAEIAAAGQSPAEFAKHEVNVKTKVTCPKCGHQISIAR